MDVTLPFAGMQQAGMFRLDGIQGLRGPSPPGSTILRQSKFTDRRPVWVLECCTLQSRHNRAILMA
jgi:hypothetical protein